MSPVEIWCNEAEHVLAVMPEDVDTFDAICKREAPLRGAG